jgi:hypothetical protein
MPVKVAQMNNRTHADRPVQPAGGIRRLVIALVILLLPASAQSARTAELCIEDWSTALPVVKEEGLATVAAVAKLARERFKGEIVKVTLCQRDSRYVYRILMRGANGRLARVIVDAKEPFGR